MPAALIGYRIFGQVINRVGKIAEFGHKQRKNIETRAEHPPYPILLGEHSG